MIAYGLAYLLAPMGIGPNPIDEVPPGLDPDTVTPGVAGFIAIALVAIASILLVVDMSRRIRRVRYRGEIRERLEAEQLIAEKNMVAEGGPAYPDPAALAAERRIDRNDKNGGPVA